MEKKFYRPDEVAEIFRISIDSVYRLIKTGKLPAVKINSLWRVPAAALAALCNPHDDRVDTK